MKKLFLLVLGIIALLTFVACSDEDPVETDTGLPDDTGMPEEDDPFQLDEDDIFDDTQQEPDLPEVVASVNGDEIFSEDVLNLQMQMQMQGMQVDTEEIVSQLITHKLLAQEAERRGFEASVEDVEERLVQQGESLEAVKETLEAQGMDYDEFLESQIQDTVLIMFIEDQSEQVEISEEEAREFYDEQAEALGEERPFEESKDDIKEFLAQDHANFLLSQLAGELMEEADVEVFY